MFEEARACRKQAATCIKIADIYFEETISWFFKKKLVCKYQPVNITCFKEVVDTRFKTSYVSYASCKLMQVMNYMHYINKKIVNSGPGKTFI